MAFRSDGTSAYLAGLLEKKKLHLEEILAVTKKQTGMIREETTEELTGLIAQKQKEIDLINEIDDEFIIAFQRLKEELGIEDMGQIQKEGVPELKAVTELTSEILKITGEINILEQNNLNKAKTLLDDLGHEIKKLNQARKTNNVYSLNNKSTQGYFIDSKK